MTKKLLADITFNSCAQNLQKVRGLVKAGARDAGCSEELVDRLVLVIDEACANVIRHAYRDDPCGPIRLKLAREDDELIFWLRDFADPVDVGCIKPRDLGECRPGGLGINFIDSVMDEWRFLRPDDGRGNILRMTKKIA